MAVGDTKDYTDIPPLIPQIPLGDVERKIVRRVRRKDERLHNEHIRKQLTEHHLAHLEELKQRHAEMLANLAKPVVYELEVNDTGGLLHLPNGVGVIIQDNYYCRAIDPVTGMERVFGLSPEEVENYYEDHTDEITSG
jgi:hypothetical protein